MDRQRTTEELCNTRSDDANGFVGGACEEDGQLQNTILYLDATPYLQCSLAFHFHQHRGLFIDGYTPYMSDNQCSGFVINAKPLHYGCASRTQLHDEAELLHTRLR